MTLRSISPIMVLASVMTVAAVPPENASVPTPAGIFVCRGPGPTPDREVDYPFIDGWLVRPGWDAVEPKDGQFDWSYVEGEIATAKRLKKRITLTILGG